MYISGSFQVEVFSVVGQLQEDLDNQLEWSDEVSDEETYVLSNLVSQGYVFESSAFTGGVCAADILLEGNEEFERKLKEQKFVRRSRKGKLFWQPCPMGSLIWPPELLGFTKAQLKWMDEHVKKIPSSLNAFEVGSTSSKIFGREAGVTPIKTKRKPCGMISSKRVMLGKRKKAGVTPTNNMAYKVTPPPYSREEVEISDVVGTTATGPTRGGQDGYIGSCRTGLLSGEANADISKAKNIRGRGERMDPGQKPMRRVLVTYPASGGCVMGPSNKICGEGKGNDMCQKTMQHHSNKHTVSEGCVSGQVVTSAHVKTVGKGRAQVCLSGQPNVPHADVGMLGPAMKLG